MSRPLPGRSEGKPLRANRRGEPRKPAGGTGWMEPMDRLGREEFRLVDTSPSGFRARHGCVALTAGQKVRFQHERAEGVAIVVWNCVTGAEVESGFLVVPGRI
jgi:hypothetical protein